MLGEIPVTARLDLGSERLTIVLTTTRIIAARIGKRGAGALAATSFFGSLSGALEDLLKSGKESLSQRKLDKLSPRELLASHKDNFAIGLDEVVKVEVEETAGLVSLIILTRNEKLELSTRSRFESVTDLLGSALGPKVVARRLSDMGKRVR